jgi:hypothetical protein
MSLSRKLLLDRGLKVSPRERVHITCNVAETVVQKLVRDDLTDRRLPLVDGIDSFMAETKVFELRGVAHVGIAEIDEITIYKPEISLRRRYNADGEISKKLGLARVLFRSFLPDMVKRE